MVVPIPSSAAWQRLLVIAGSLVLLVAACYWAKPLLLPLVLAVLLAFILSPVVILLQRHGFGRIPAVLLIVVLAFSILGGIGYVVTGEIKSLAKDLPNHKSEIVQKIKNVREAGKGSWVEEVIDTVRDVNRRVVDGEQPAADGEGASPVTVTVESPQTPLLQSVGLSALDVLLTAGLVVVLVIFMLVYREDLRNRLIRLWGNASLTRMTKAIDDATSRISRYLLMQAIINSCFGVAFGIGLSLIGVPYAVLWGFLAGALRYIPYIGSALAALLPVVLSFAMMPGWTAPILVIALFVTIELVTYNVIEPWFFGQSVGVSPVALLIAAAFWAWLWGPLGLVLATPLTACLVVLGKYFPQLEFLSILLGDEPTLEPHVMYYQRLLARDTDEAVELIDEYVQSHPAEEVYDQVILPALVLAKQNRGHGEFTRDDEQFIYQATREILDELAAPQNQDKSEAPESDGKENTKVLVLGCPARDEADELALQMFRQLLDLRGCEFDIVSAKALASEVVSRVRHDDPTIICIAAVPPQGVAHTRYLCKRLRSEFPRIKVFVGCWGLKIDVERTRQRLLAGMADHVGTTLLESRNKITPEIQVQAHVSERRMDLAGASYPAD